MASLGVGLAYWRSSPSTSEWYPPLHFDKNIVLSQLLFGIFPHDIPLLLFFFPIFFVSFTQTVPKHSHSTRIAA